MATSTKSELITLSMVKPDDGKDGRHILLGDRILYVYRCQERRKLKGDVMLLERMLPDGTAKHLAGLRSSTIILEDGSQHVYRKLFESKKWHQSRGQFETAQHGTLGFKLADWKDRVKLRKILDDGSAGEEIAYFKPKWAPMFSSSNDRGTIDLYDPDLFIDSQQQPTDLLTQVIVYFFAYVRVESEIAGRGSGAAGSITDR